MLEVLFAVAILAIVLLTSMAVLLQRARSEETIERHRGASRALAIAHEVLRAGGSLPATPTPSDPLLPPPWAGSLPEGGLLWAERRATATEGLVEVEIVARYEGGGRVHFDRRTTLVWTGP